MISRTLGLLAWVLAFPSPAARTLPSEVSARLSVSVEIPERCLIDASSTSAPGYPIAAAGVVRDRASSGSITTTCTCGSDPQVTLDLRGGAGCTAVWNTDADSSPPACGEGVPQSFTVYGEGGGRTVCRGALVATVTF